MYTQKKLGPLWRHILFNEGSNPPDGLGIAGGANLIIALVIHYGENKKWPNVGELAERLLNGVDAKTKDLHDRIKELDSMGDVETTPAGPDYTWDSVVALSPARIAKVNDVLDQNGIEKLNVE